MLFLLLLFNGLIFSQSMECGLNLSTTKEITDTISTCINSSLPTTPEPKAENSTNVSNVTTVTDSSEDGLEEPKVYGPRRGLSISIPQKREVQSTPNDNKALANDTLINNITSTTPSTVQNGQHQGNQTRCVVQCILQHFQMLGTSGFPELEKVSAVLLRIAPENREMRDLIKDSIDECFIHMSEYGVEQDPCANSAYILTCLADKAKFNCADFPVGELPFPHVF